MSAEADRNHEPVPRTLGPAGRLFQATGANRIEVQRIVADDPHRAIAAPRTSPAATSGTAR